MKDSAYPLQRLLEIKIKKEEEATLEMAEEKSKLKQEEEKERLLKTEKEKVQQQLQNLSDEINENLFQNSMMIYEIAQYRNYKQALENKIVEIEKDIDQQQIKVKKAQLRVNQAREKLIQACKERQVIEKHKENWLTQIKKQILKKEQKEQDEIGGLRYSFKDRL
ncbi:MAG: hypothetical protein AB1414_00300 [bacterium]